MFQKMNKFCVFTTDYNELLPKGILFNIKEINDMRLIKSDMLKKLIYYREIEVV